VAFATLFYWIIPFFFRIIINLFFATKVCEERGALVGVITETSVPLITSIAETFV